MKGFRVNLAFVALYVPKHDFYLFLFFVVFFCERLAFVLIVECFLLQKSHFIFKWNVFSWVFLLLHGDIISFSVFFLRKTRIYSHCSVFLVPACECDPAGSAALHCERNTGKCECLPGIGGHKCDRCARGTTGQIPYCEPCGECFDNWDRIIEELKSKCFATYICVAFYNYKWLWAHEIPETKWWNCTVRFVFILDNGSFNKPLTTPMLWTTALIFLKLRLSSTTGLHSTIFKWYKNSDVVNTA